MICKQETKSWYGLQATEESHFSGLAISERNNAARDCQFRRVLYGYAQRDYSSVRMESEIQPGMSFVRNDKGLYFYVTWQILKRKYGEQF